MCSTSPRGDSGFIEEFPLTIVCLSEDQFFPGWTLLILKRHATELFHLNSAERAQMLEDVNRVATALDKVFHPVKINYELLGNRVPHIHWHIVPRLATDPIPEWPIWRHDHDPLPLPAEQRRLRAAAIRAALHAAP